MILEYIIKENDSYINLNDLLKNHFEISERLLVKLKHNQKIYLNNMLAYINAPLHVNDKIKIFIDFVENNSNIVSTKMKLNIIYEDDALLILNKPSGLPVHPSMEHYSDSLSNGVKYYFDKIGLKKMIRPVNRIDKDTSGLVIFAKNEYIQECLIKQMKRKQFIKEYLAICNGIFASKKRNC